MRKLLLLLPVVLILLNFLPVSLHKDTVNYGGSLDTLQPRYWTMIDTQVNVSVSAKSPNFLTKNNSGSTPVGETLNQGAKFHGFPFGAYFSKTSQSKLGDSVSYFSASAYAWLWVLVDAALILLSFGFAWKFK